LHCGLIINLDDEILAHFSRTNSTAEDGAGLFCGVLKHLALRGTACPKVLAATHFHDVFRDDLLSPRLLPITFVHMQVMLSTSQGHMLGASSVSEAESSDFNEAWEDEVEGRMVAPGERITYLYRVAKGFSLDSHAAMCAEIFGIPRRIANRARYVRSVPNIRETCPSLSHLILAHFQQIAVHARAWPTA